MEARARDLITQYLPQCSEEEVQDITQKFVEEVSRVPLSPEVTHETIISGLIARLQQLEASRRDPEETERADIVFLRVFPEYLLNFVSIVYEDAETVVVAKPFDFRVDLGKNNQAESFANEPNLRAWFGTRYPAIPFRMCHQLDYATSGLMILAKSQKQCAKINKEFALRRIHKSYLAVVEGFWDNAVSCRDADNALMVQETAPDTITVEFHIARASPTAKNMMVVGDTHPSAQLCQTSVQVVSRHTLKHAGRNWHLTKLRLFPHTGRTHQLRVTTSALGHPILGDRKYGERGGDWDRIHRDMPRMYLHAQSLKLSMGGVVKDFECVDCLNPPSISSTSE